VQQVPVACSKYFVPPDLSPSRDCARRHETGGIRLASIPGIVVCLAPAFAVEGFLGFLNTLNIAVAEVT
jgi:hypothetical protein